MLTHGAEFFTMRPGLILTAVGLFLTLPLTFGPVHIGRLTFSLYSMLLGLTLSVLGTQTAFVGCLTEILHDYDGNATRRLCRLFSYNRSVVVSLVLLALGAGLMTPLVRDYLILGFTLPVRIGPVHHMAITGLLFVILAFSQFVFTLVIHSTVLRVWRRDAPGND
jgi:hypothetical protein